jgi:hypothetical protein
MEEDNETKIITPPTHSLNENGILVNGVNSDLIISKPSSSNNIGHIENNIKRGKLIKLIGFYP